MRITKNHSPRGLQKITRNKNLLLKHIIHDGVEQWFPNFSPGGVLFWTNFNHDALRWTPQAARKCIINEHYIANFIQLRVMRRFAGATAPHAILSK